MQKSLGGSKTKNKKAKKRKIEKTDQQDIVCDVEASKLQKLDEKTEEKAASTKTAMLFSRTNTLLSLPMLLSMVAAQNLY